MAQPRPTPMTAAIELVDDAALVESDPFADTNAWPDMSRRDQLMINRQLLAMAYRGFRGQFGITKAAEVHDHANAQVTASLLFSLHQERGFPEGTLSEEERAYFTDGRMHMIRATEGITGDATSDLRAMAHGLELPRTKVRWWES